MNLAIGSDHAGYDLKELFKQHLLEQGHTVTDLGGFAPQPIDYPVAGQRVAKAVAAGQYEKGILICGTGVGISIAANKVHGARAVVCSEPYSAVLSRKHNDSNILALGARVVGSELALMILDQWLAAEFEGGRHARRVGLICDIEREENR